MRIPIHLGDGFMLGIGDSNRDGKLDFDFGLRSQSYGNGPFGGGHAGGEIGFNTQRGLYLGGDVSSHNRWGASGAGGRVFSDGGFQSGQWSNDVFGNYQNSQQAGGPGWYSGGGNAGNVYSGNYSGYQTDSNYFGRSNSNWAGNSWSGANISNHSYSNVFGGHGGYSVGTPPFVPSYGGGHHHGCGCGSAGRFMGW